MYSSGYVFADQTKVWTCFQHILWIKIEFKTVKIFLIVPHTMEKKYKRNKWNFHPIKRDDISYQKLNSCKQQLFLRCICSIWLSNQNKNVLW